MLLTVGRTPRSPARAAVPWRRAPRQAHLVVELSRYAAEA
jgi:hypothetical protein